jgi:Spy/CpxP family protein refolding chaperone
MLGGAGRIDKMADKLELTDDQVDRIENLRYDMEMRGIDIKADLEKRRLELKKLMGEEEKDRKKILAQVTAVNEVEGDLSIVRVEGMLDINDVLTKEQREQLDELRKKGEGMRTGDRPMKGSSQGDRSDMHSKTG